MSSLCLCKWLGTHCFSFLQNPPKPLPSFFIHSLFFKLKIQFLINQDPLEWVHAVTPAGLDFLGGLYPPLCLVPFAPHLSRPRLLALPRTRAARSYV